MVSITGVSKSGKTVLCHKAIDKNAIVDISGTQIQTQQDFWRHLSEKVRLPQEGQKTHSHSDEFSAEAKADGKLGIPLVASANVAAKGSYARTIGQNVSEKEIYGSNRMIEYLIKNKKILVIDDFHYIADELQMYIARILKTELFNGLKAIIISLPHRADDAIRHNPDLIGRTAFIEIAPWAIEELKEIGCKGFQLLGYEIAETALQLLARESVASPQLMQENCLSVSDRVVENKSSDRIDEQMVKEAFHDTGFNYAHYCTILKQVLKGSAQGRKHRKQYQCADGECRDVYQVLIESIALDPPALSISMEDFKIRIAKILSDQEKLPSALTISNTMTHIEEIMRIFLPKLDTLEWREQQLYLLDPFLIFYLRWGRMA